MCDWDWEDMAYAGLLGEMIADEMEEEAIANKENEPLTPDEILESQFDYLGKDIATVMRFNCPLN